MKSIDIIMFAFFCFVSIIFIILIVYNYISSRKSKFLKSETRLTNPPPPSEKSIDDMSVLELYESYEFHRNKTIELGKAVKQLESAVSEFRKNKNYEI